MPQTTSIDLNTQFEFEFVGKSSLSDDKDCNHIAVAKMTILHQVAEARDRGIIFDLGHGQVIIQTRFLFHIFLNFSKTKRRFKGSSLILVMER